MGDRSMIGRAICEKAAALGVRPMLQRPRCEAWLLRPPAARPPAATRSTRAARLPASSRPQASAVVIASHAKSALSEFMLGRRAWLGEGPQEGGPGSRA